MYVLYAAKLFLIFLVFGYFEKVFCAGYMIGLLMGLCSFYNFQSIPILLIALLQFSLHYGSLKELSYVCFFAVDVIFVFYEPPILLNAGDNSLDMHITFRPFEKEIRSLLFKRCPSILHRVDKLLDRNQGHERQLYEYIQEEYKKSKYDSQKELKPQLKPPSTTPSRSYNENGIVNPGMLSIDLENVHSAMYRARQAIAHHSPGPTPYPSTHRPDPRL